ncbi:MAG: SH3 domain-containing protein [Dehalococcoidia bacterium]
MLLAACGGSAPSRTPTPGAVDETATPTQVAATATPRPPNAWYFAPATPLPADVALWIERGCWQCDAPPEQVDLAVGRGSGRSAIRPLLPKLNELNRYYANVRFAPGGSEGYAMVCSRGYCGGVGQISPDAQNTLRRTRDGGITWEDVGTFDGMVGIAAVTPDGPIIVRTLVVSPGGLRSALTLLDGKTAVTPPSPGAGLIGRQPSATTLLWLATDRVTLLTSANEIVFRLERGADPHPELVLDVIAGTPDLRRLLVQWVTNDGIRYGLIRDGVLEREIRKPSESFAMFLGAWLEDDIIVATVGGSPLSTQGVVPALVNLQTLEITPLAIDGPPNAAVAWARSLVLAAAKGPFVTASTAGDCLNVRESPVATAATYGCFRDGTPFRVRESPEAGAAWIAVFAPDGRPGWVNAQFVEK